MFEVKQKFTIVDRFQASYKIAEVLYSDLPAWVSKLIPVVSQQEVRYALDRWAEPLVRQLEISPQQNLDRIEKTAKLCTLREGCFGWRLDKCTNLKKNTCALLVIPGKTEDESIELTTLVNLWRDSYYVVSVKTDS